jgi:hemerythrin-like domain-containing protein
MRRHDSLIPLTHDHHHALAQARRLRLAAGQGDEERLRQAREFVDFFESDTLRHFREEEELVFPFVVDEADVEPVLTRIMMEHLRIHAVVRALKWELERGAPGAASLSRLAMLLEEHIRLEEKTLFPLIQRIVPEVLLRTVTLSHQATSADRAAAGTGVAVAH